MRTKTFTTGFFIILMALLFGEQIWQFVLAVSGNFFQSDLMQLKVPLLGKMYLVLKHSIISFFAMIGGFLARKGLFES